LLLCGIFDEVFFQLFQFRFIFEEGLLVLLQILQQICGFQKALELSGEDADGLNDVNGSGGSLGWWKSKFDDAFNEILFVCWGSLNNLYASLLNLVEDSLIYLRVWVLDKFG
tara:strand:+ start:1426 stop:1761 length:336 start_codon:yes stop_codon:yes gene_type:complete